jgi:tetratricopeptide (TPR) repeat protein
LREQFEDEDEYDALTAACPKTALDTRLGRANNSCGKETETVEDSGRYDAINATLRRLEQYSTLSPFCRAFYRLIYELLGDPEMDSAKLRQAFHVFLRCECRRHQTVCRIVKDGGLDLAKIVRSGRQTHDLLEWLAGALRQMKFDAPRQETIRQLLLAECNYHLGHTSQVVHELRRAVRLGCDHPLVHFALGYNLYSGAVQRFARVDDRKGTVAVKDPAAFQSACLQAIAAFEQGLGHEDYDGQLYWWMGLIWEMLGERHSACGAYRRAMETDPDHFAERTREKLRLLEPQALPLRTEEELERLSKLGPITDEELRATRETLDACDSFPSVFFE